MTLFDTHCHLDDARFRGELDEIVTRARDAGLVGVVTVGTSAVSTQAAVDIARRHAGVWAAAGVHPNDAETIPDEAAFQPIARLAAEPEVVAIGETGLDYYRDHARPERQHALLSMHFDLARRTGKPLIIHCRDAHPDFFERISADMPAPVRGVMHCFSGSAEMARKYLDLGLHISIAGPVTYPNAAALRDVVKTLPLDRLLVETDSPYLAPQEFRGKRNEPSYVRFTALKIAEIHRRPPEQVFEATTRNGRELFDVR